MTTPTREPELETVTIVELERLRKAEAELAEAKAQVVHLKSKNTVAAWKEASDKAEHYEAMYHMAMEDISKLTGYPLAKANKIAVEAVVAGTNAAAEWQTKYYSLLAEIEGLKKERDSGAWVSGIDKECRKRVLAENAALRASLKEMVEGMQAWLDADECACEDIDHVCGRPKVTRIVTRARALLSKEEQAMNCDACGTEMRDGDFDHLGDHVRHKEAYCIPALVRQRDALQKKLEEAEAENQRLRDALSGIQNSVKGVMRNQIQDAVDLFCKEAFSGILDALGPVAEKPKLDAKEAGVYSAEMEKELDSYVPMGSAPKHVAPCDHKYISPDGAVRYDVCIYCHEPKPSGAERSKP